MKLHAENTIDYEGESKLMKVHRNEFFNFGGDIKLSVVQMPLEGCRPTPLVEKHLKQIRAVNLWVYKGRRVTTWHYDGHDNFLYQFSGKKVFYLLPPQTLKARNVFSLFNNHAENVE